MVGAGDDADDDASGPGVLEEVAWAGRGSCCLAGCALVFEGATDLEDLGDGLGFFVGEVPVDGHVAGVGELVGDVDEVGLEFSQVLPEFCRCLAAAGVEPSGEVGIGEDQVTVSVEAIGVFFAVLFEGRGPFLAEEGEEAARVVVDAGELCGVVPGVGAVIVAVIGDTGEVVAGDVAEVLVAFVDRFVADSIADRHFRMFV